MCETRTLERARVTPLERCDARVVKGCFHEGYKVMHIFMGHFIDILGIYLTHFHNEFLVLFVCMYVNYLLIVNSSKMIGNFLAFLN